MHDGKLDFAPLESWSAPTMLVRAAGPINPRQQRVRFYLYVEDSMRFAATWARTELAPVRSWTGRGGQKREMTVRDPDGYCLMIAEID